MLITASGKKPITAISGASTTKPMRTTRFCIGRTLSMCPAPIRLLVRVLAVEARAMTVMKVNEEMFRTMLVAARLLSPKCSTERKKRNQVASERKFCTMVHTLMPRILPNRLKRNRGRRLSAYWA